MGTFDWNFATGKVDWSPELEAMHGYEPGGFGGTVEAYKAEIHADDMPAIEASVHNAITTGAKHHVIYRITKPDGSLGWVEGNGKIILDRQGAPARLVGVCMDVTDRMKTETALATRVNEQAALYEFTDRLQRAASMEEVFESALDSITTALGCDRASILLFDENGVMSFVGWRGLSDEYRCAVNGHTPWRPETKNPDPICVRDIEETNESAALKATILGEGIRGLAFIPLPGEKGLLGKFMVYYKDAHNFTDEEVDLATAIGRQLAFAVERRRAEAERSQAEESLRQLTAELEEKVRLRTADLEGFAYSIAHDMRQHIRGVSVNAAMVMHEAADILPKDTLDNLERLVHAAKHLSKLTDDILTHTKIGVRDISKAHIDLSQMVAKMAPETIARPHSNPTTRVEVQPGITALADPSMISLVVENLLDNACKFSAGVPEPRVAFGRDEHGYFFSDNGIGFDSKYSEKIFHAFERLEPSFEGTGIGLASVRRIVERHGGRVWADSEPGQGTTIRFTLSASGA
jgi:PAS domain S-box-containing protein